VAAESSADDLSALSAGVNVTGADVCWAAECEGVLRLDDLLLRRTRLGLLCPDGGLGLLERVRRLAQARLGWSDGRWGDEVDRYRALWRNAYAPPHVASTEARSAI
jgi:glycerol-3-phosphate dehydrogenase